MKDDIFHLIAGRAGENVEQTFQDLALRLFRYQYENNPPYRRFCESQRASPATVRRWESIPALPVTAFKWADISCRPPEEAFRIFYSSGTTQGQKSRHYVFDDYMAKGAILTHFKRHVLPDRDQIRMMILTPSPEDDPHASLSYMMSVVRDLFGAAGSDYYVKNGVLQSKRLAEDLASANEPIALLGTAFSFVHFFDACHRREIRLRLPPKSRLMDTGGLKGKSRAVPPGWIYERAEAILGIVDAYCVNEYGMSEMSSQFYDRIAGQEGPRLFVAPPQVRTRILSPETLKPVASGSVGMLAIVDLANCESATAILTEDLGKKVGEQFTLIGRNAHADPKGCSISFDELMDY